MIRSIHRYADWLTAHPETPAPRWITGSTLIRPVDEPNVDTRIAQVAEWAESVGARRSLGTREGVSATLTVIENPHVEIQHMVMAAYDGWDA